MVAMVSRLKILARKDVTERRRPQVGRIKTLTANKHVVELRFLIIPMALGQKLVVHIFDASLTTQSFGHLGLANKDLKCRQRIFISRARSCSSCRPYGLREE